MNTVITAILQPHQQRVVRRMVDEDVRGLVVAHSEGSGQMVTTCTIARELLAKNSIEHVVVLTTRSKMSQWIAQTRRSSVSQSVRIFVNRKWLTDLGEGSTVIAPNTLMVVDEAHTMRTKITIESVARGSCLAFNMVGACASPNVARVLLLSDTSVMNQKLDVTNLALSLRGRGWSEMMLDMKQLTDRAWLSTLMDYHVHETEHMPWVVEEFVDMVMSPEYLKYYMDVEGKQRKLSALANEDDLQRFVEKVRKHVASGQLVTSPPTSPKMAWLGQKFYEWVVVDRSKIAIFSAWKDYGLGSIERMLQRMGINFEVIDGQKSDAQIQLSVEKYNCAIHPVRVIVFTSAAACEEFMLRATDYLVIMEPHRNKAMSDQAIKKVASSQSHAHLSENRQVVRVKRLMLSKPDAEFDYPSSDDFMLGEQIAETPKEKKAVEIEVHTPIPKAPRVVKADRFAPTPAAKAVMRAMKKRPSAMKAYVSPKKVKFELIPLDMEKEFA